MLSCKEAPQMLSDGMDRPLRSGERLRLRLHLLMCHGCRNARRQMEFMRHACQAWMRRDE